MTSSRPRHLPFAPSPATLTCPSLRSPISAWSIEMMLRGAASFYFAIILFCSLFASAQQRNRDDRQPPSAPAGTPAAETKPSEARKEVSEPAPVVTHHEIHVGGKTLRYTATAGMLPLKNVDTGEVEAHIFYIAYTLDGQQA